MMTTPMNFHICEKYDTEELQPTGEIDLRKQRHPSFQFGGNESSRETLNTRYKRNDESLTKYYDYCSQ